MTFQVLITIICDNLAIINCLDYILCIFSVRARIYVAERNRTPTDKEHNGKLDADRLLP